MSNGDDELGLACLGYVAWGWLHGDYDDGCCLGCVVMIVAGLVGVGLVVHWLF